MNIKRSLSAAAVVLATALIPAPVAAASDVRGPACADVTDGAGVYNASGVSLRLSLAAPSCRQATYTLYVLSADGTTQLVTATATRTDGTFAYFDNVAVPGDHSTVCVYATTSVGRHVFDRAPDEGCVILGAGGVPALSMR